MNDAAFIPGIAMLLRTALFFLQSLALCMAEMLLLYY